jgi:hypothetical protein
MGLDPSGPHVIYTGKIRGLGPRAGSSSSTATLLEQYLTSLSIERQDGADCLPKSQAADQTVC